MQFASMSLGIFDFLIEWLTQFLIWIVQFALELVGQLISLILYGVCVDFLKIVGFIQKMFYKLCGLGSYWVNGVEMKETDPLLSIITDKSVLQILLALTLVAVAMVIVATIIQVLRTEFSTEGSKNTKGQVFGQAIKALVMFALVPICSAGGILITNALLKAVNAATSLGAESSVGGAVYVASTYSANHIRNGGTIQSITASTNGNYVIKIKGTYSFMSITKEKEYKCTISGEAVSYLGGASLSVDQGNREEIAQKIDNAFRSGYISFDDKTVANTFYDVYSINFITFLGGGILAAYTMLMASFGMIMRLYKGAVLFVISPAMTGLMPLDNGNAFKDWRKAFLKQILSAYGTIVGMNILFILLPIVGNIKLFEGSSGGSINSFVQMLFTLTGLFMLKSMSSDIANLIGADDASASGAGMAGKVLGTAAKIGTVAVGGVGGALAKGVGAGAAGLAKATGKQGFAMAANTFGGLGNKMGQRAKGTAGSALNKISNVATGGEFKGPLSEEKDFAKAQEAKQKKVKERNERLENGAGSLGDLMSKKYNDVGGAAGIAGSVVGGAAGLAGAAAYNLAAAYDNAAFGTNFERKSLTKAMKSGAGIGHSIGKGVDATGRAISDGGAALTKEYSENYSKHKADSAVAQSTANEVQKTYIDDNKKAYEKVSSAFKDDQIAKIVTALKQGDSLTAADTVSSMLDALNNIAEKTEDQKDMIQKLTTLQSQISSASNNKAAQGRLANNATFFGDLTAKADKVSTEANGMVKNLNSYNVDVDSHIDVKADITKQLDTMAEKISKITGKNITELKYEIEKIQKKNLEEAKAKKENK